MLQAGAIVADHLRLVRQLGSGGMGSVWVAEQTRLGGQVAVKFLSTALLDHESARSRFDREARLAAKIKSQHVVQVHDHGVTKTEPAIPYIVMELLDGVDLSKVLDRDGPLGLTRAAEILSQVCDALTKAHDAGIVHRDIKPENVFVLNETRTFIKLLDFGVAHGKDGQLDRLTQTGLLLGTAHYMSPEQLFSGKDIDLRADLWALGILTYQMLANEVPFQAETFGQLCLQVRDGSFPAVSSKVNVPPGVDQWFAKALANDRVNRFQSANEMALAFYRVIAGELLSASNSSMPAGSQTTGTGTVRVDKSEVSRLREEIAKSAGPVSHGEGTPPPATQRFGSHSGLTSAVTQHGTEAELLGPGPLSSARQPAFTSNSSSSHVVSGASISNSTPLADLSGSFGTEAKGVLSLTPRAAEAKGRGKWIGLLVAAVALGGGAMFMLRQPATATTAPAAGGPEVSSLPPIGTPVTEVIKTNVDGAPVASGTVAMGASTDASNVRAMAPGESTAEKPAADGNEPSTSAENAVTGGALLATPGNLGSAGQRGPKPSGATKPPKSNDHATSDKPSIPAPAHVAPAPTPDPTAQRKPKYRGF